MNSVSDIIYLRRPIINYESPPICEVIFSGSSNPVIILSSNPLSPVTGLVLGGFSGFRLSWNAYPGAICFNIYFIAAGTTVAVLLAECVQSGYELPNPGPGEGEITVTPITEDEGEGPPADPIPYPTPGGGGASEVIVESLCRQTGREDFPATFRISRQPGDTIGNLEVDFELTGDAVNGVDYQPVPLSATIPNGSEFVMVDIVVIEAALAGVKSVILTLSPSPFYDIGTPNFSFIDIRPPQLLIPGYGDTEPLFTPPAAASDSERCEWDGTWNYFIPPSSTPEGVYYYQDIEGHVGERTEEDVLINSIEQSIQGKQMHTTFVSGPYAAPFPDFWQVTIECRDAENTHIVWRGFKVGGGSPAGVYTYATGSDVRPTLTIALFP